MLSKIATPSSRLAAELGDSANLSHSLPVRACRDRSWRLLLSSVLLITLSLGSSLKAQDTDGDSVPDITDIDDDNDGILDTVENGVNAISAGGPGSFGSGAAAFGTALSAAQTAYPFRAGTSASGRHSVIKNTDSLELLLFNAYRTVRDRTNPGNGYYAYFDMGVSDRGSAMFQESLALKPNQTYELSFWLAGPYLPSLFTNSTGILGIEIDGTLVDSVVIANNSDWREYTYRFTSNGTGTAAFALINNSTGGTEGSDVALDDLFVREILDSDGDGVSDLVDLDSDNDGIPDNVEAQTTATYIAPNNDSPATYTANNGLNSAYLGGLTPTNSDGEDAADYLDTDSDNDGFFDITESGLGISADVNGRTIGTVGNNGLDNAVEATDDFTDATGNAYNNGTGEFTLSDSDSDVNPGRANAVPITIDYDFRDVGCASQLSIYNAIITNSLATPSDIRGRAVVNQITGASSFSVGQAVSGASTIALSVQTSIDAGGPINVVNGSLWAPSAAALNGRTVNYSGGAGLVTSPAFDFASVFNSITAESARYAVLPSNSTVTIPSSPAVADLTVGGGVLDGGTAVFSVDGNSLFHNNNVQTIDLDLNGKNPAAIIINITGTNIAYDWSGENVNVLRDTTVRPKILWNFPSATTITLGKPLYGSLLAPHATLTALGGAVEGSVMAKDYVGTVAVKLPLWEGGACVGASAALSVADLSVSEGTTAASVVVSIPAAEALPVSFDYATANGSAIAGADYTASSGTATIAAGDTFTVISIPLLEDVLVEGPEDFVVNLTNPLSASIADGQATVTLNDNDTTSLSIADASENEGAATVEVTISLSNPSASPVQVDYATADGVATAGADYTATSGTATVAANATSTVILVPLLDDLIDEGTEHFVINLSSPSGAAIADGQATVTLVDDDVATTIQVVDTSASESDASVDITIELSNPSVNDVTVDFATDNGTANHPKDYNKDNGSVTIPAGATSAIATIGLKEDSLVEGNEFFLLDLSNPIGASIADGTATITILDNDNAGITIADLALSEAAGTAELAVLLSNPSVSDITVDFSTSNGTALAGSDYTGESGTVTMTAGDTSAMIPITILNDSIFERNEAFVVDLSNPSGAAIADNQATVTIVDDECDDTPFLIQDTSADLYALDTLNANATLLSANIAANRINGLGYNSTDHFLWGFKQRSPWNTIVRINADYSVSEFVIPGLSAADYDTGDVDSSGILHLGRTEVATIKRIDVNPNSPNYLQLLPDLTLSRATTWADWAFSSVDGHLYTVNRAEDVYRINTTSGVVSKLGGFRGVKGDGLFGAAFSDVTGALYVARDDTGIVYRIPDVHALTGGTKPVREYYTSALGGEHRDGARCNLAPPPTAPLRVNIADTQVTEGTSTAMLSIALTATHSAAVTVDYTTFNNTASAGSDYTAKTGSVTIPSGALSADVSVSLLQDSAPEGQESFFVVISNPTDGILADDVGIVSITDDDAEDTDRDGVPDIDDIDDDDDGILDVDEALVNASCPNNVEVILLLDNSGSISSSEWDSFSTFTRDVIDELGASGTVRMAVAHYWSDWDGSNAYLYLESDFTTDPSAAKSFTRRGTGQDELERTIPLLANALNGTGVGVSGGSSTLTHLPGSNVQVLFMTDAVRDVPKVSTLVDTATPGDPFHFMNDFKTQFDATVTSIRFDLGSAIADSEANAAAAALASVGGIYTGNLDSNPTDPEGSGTIPRRFYNVNNFGGISATLAAEIADLTCESTADFDSDGIPDHLDIDSDNDGIPDNVEAQSTEGYVEPNGDASPINQGLDSAYTGGLAPVDSDQDLVADVYDTDSDNDGVADILENGDSDNSLTGIDSDEDGLDNAFDSEHVVWDSNDHIFDPNPGTLGDIDQDLAANGDNATAMIRDVDYRDPGKQNTYGNWKSLYGLALGAETGPGDNPDGDLYDNLLEYAICLHPGSGAPGPGGFFLGADVTGNVHARFYRPKGGLSDVSYEIHGRVDLPIEESETWSIMFTVPGNGSAPSGVTVTDLGGAIEEVRIENLQGMAPLTPKSGFVRLAVSNGNHLSYAPVWGWTETVVEAGQSETYANPFSQPELLSGVIGAIVGTHGIDVSVATGGAPLENDVQTLVEDYFVEIIEGQHVGHRFDVTSVNGSTIVLAADTNLYQGPPYNTQVTPVGVPATLVGNRFVLRKHYSLEDLFPADAFTPQAHTFVAGHPADRVYLFESDWEPYWLYANATGSAPYWDLDGDAFFVDAGRRVVPPGGGIFLVPQETTITLIGLGIVRKNPFAMPLPQGWSLQASPFPLDQGPAERYMNQDTFVGSDDPATSDTVCFWLGNRDTYQPEFRCAFLYDPMTTETPRWLYSDDEFLAPRDFETEIFPRDRSSFYFRYNAAKPEYVIPLPWCIELIGE